MTIIIVAIKKFPLLCRHSTLHCSLLTHMYRFPRPSDSPPYSPHYSSLSLFSLSRVLMKILKLRFLLKAHILCLSILTLI
jgi:hypothetical protein